MPSSEKSTNALPGNVPRSLKAKPKATQRPVAKAGAQAEKDTETDEREAAEERERKTSSKLPAAKAAPAAPRPEARVRKLTPQQQIHAARGRRRKLKERLVLGFIAVVVIGLIAVVTWQVIAKNQADARLASAHAAATATAAVKATATENANCPAVPPAISGATVTTKDGLQYIDTKVGTGPAVKKGDTINVRYTGWLQATQVKFDCSYDDNKGTTPTQFQLVGPDQNGVIQGWVEGIIGMKAGGTRRLIIPPALAYGADGSPPIIPGNATLIFDVELVSIGTASS